MAQNTRVDVNAIAVRPYIGLESNHNNKDVNASAVVDVAFLKHANLLLQQQGKLQDTRSEADGRGDDNDVWASPIAQCVLRYGKTGSDDVSTTSCTSASIHVASCDTNTRKEQRSNDAHITGTPSHHVQSHQTSRADPPGTDALSSLPLALARRGVVMRDPLLKRLERKKKLMQSSQPTAPSQSHQHSQHTSESCVTRLPHDLGTALTIASAALGSAHALDTRAAAPAHTLAYPTVQHWTQRRRSEMNRASWTLFREQVGIEVEIVSHRRRVTTRVAGAAPTAAPASLTHTDEKKSMQRDDAPPAVSRALGPTTQATAATATRYTADSIAPIRCWEEAQLPYALGRRVAELYRLPTAIQSVLVPWAQHTHSSKARGGACDDVDGLSAHALASGERVKWDVVAVAETGSGKTAAYLIPLLVSIHVCHPKLLASEELIALGPFALVLVPTRELAEQVTHELHRILAPFQSDTNNNNNNNNNNNYNLYNVNSNCSSNNNDNNNSAQLHPWEQEELSLLDAATRAHYTATHNMWGEIRVIKIIGGESSERQYAALSRGAHMVVGTVGQLDRLRQDRLLSLGNVRHVVMDEADRMVETSTQEALLVAVLQQCPPTRQTILVSATLPPRCVRLAQSNWMSVAESSSSSSVSSGGGDYVLLRCPHRCARIMQCFDCVTDTVAEGATTMEDEEGDEKEKDDEAVVMRGGPDASGNSVTRVSQRPRKQARAEASAAAAGGGGGRASAEALSSTRVRHPLIHPDKFNRLVSWLLYAPGRVVVFANEKKTCDALQDELRREHEFLVTGADGFTVEEMVGPAPSPLCLGSSNTYNTKNNNISNHSNHVNGEEANHERRQGTTDNSLKPKEVHCSTSRTAVAQLDHLRSVAVVHADLSQAERNRLVQSFQRGDRRVLLTTDLLARGLDVARVALVINYDMPKTQTRRHVSGSSDYDNYNNNNNSSSSSNHNNEDDVAAAGMTLYVHRIGRTGRAGHRGMTVSFLVVPCAALQHAQRHMQRSSQTSDKEDYRGAIQDGSHVRALSGLAGRPENADDDARRAARVRAREVAELTRGHDTSLVSYSSEDESLHADDDDDDDEEEDVCESTGATVTGAKSRQRIARRMRGGGKASVAHGDTGGWRVFYNDEALFVALWQFLCRCAEANGCRDGAQALRQGSYTNIQLSPMLASILHARSLRSSALGSIVK